MSMRQDLWTPENIEQMFTYSGQGYSASQIAGFFGTTRNAIIGKIQRERIKRGHIPAPRKSVLDGIREERISPELRRNTTPKRVFTIRRDLPDVSRAGVGFVMPAIPAPAPQTGPAVGILDVTGCKWPIAEDASLIGGKAFCNHARKDGKPYCAFHAREARSTQPVSTWLKHAVGA
jgi:GcrA cell cycle regulator